MMPNRRAITDVRPPSYLSKAKLALELDMGESTIDSYVQRGILPAPLKVGGSVRWCWAEVAASLGRQAQGSDDPFMSGIDNV